jgi:hypothetical protein
MTTNKLDPNTPNNDVGLYWRKSRRVDPLAAGLPFTIGEMASGIKCSVAGTVVIENTVNSEINIVALEAGEWVPIMFDKVLSGATIDGVAETTTATGLFWTTTPLGVGN